MSKIRVGPFSLSIDGFGAGPEQSLNDPLAKRGPEMFEWFFRTRTFHAMAGREGGSDRRRREIRIVRQHRLRCLHPRPQHVSAPYAANGPMKAGKAGGATTRRIMRQHSS